MLKTSGKGGKSTLVNKLFGQNFGGSKRTKDIVSVRVSDSITVLDFPHLNSKNEDLTGTICNTYSFLDILIVVLDAEQTADSFGETLVLKFVFKSLLFGVDRMVCSQMFTGNDA